MEHFLFGEFLKNTKNFFELLFQYFFFLKFLENQFIFMIISSCAQRISLFFFLFLASTIIIFLKNFLLLKIFFSSVRKEKKNFFKRDIKKIEIIYYFLKCDFLLFQTQKKTTLKKKNCDREINKTIRHFFSILYCFNILYVTDDLLNIIVYFYFYTFYFEVL